MSGNTSSADPAAVERLQRLREIFDQVVDQPVDRWRALVAAATEGDASLRDESLRLLDMYHRTGPDWENIRLRVGDEPEAVDRAGQRVGQYRLTRLVGRGGMGTVYEGMRADDVYEQRVAVKLIAPQLVASTTSSRFRHERQILAALEHRNIARLLDGGATAEGEPFFVMEYVEGQPITGYSDQRQLSIRDRLRLFLQVCGAVQHAHSKLIVHRDLKPANILVDNDGSVKLLDFGVAGLLGSERGGPLAAQSAPRLLTPEYASPEQLRDEDMTVRSDVYSLGVVLFRLLAGRRPYQSDSRLSTDMLRVMQVPPPRASEALTEDAVAGRRGRSLPALRRTLAGEIDAMLARALEPLPADRYASVEQFAEDIRRYLDNLPLLVSSNSARYRMQKHVQRHWIAISAVALVAVAMVGGTTAALLQARRAEVERAKAARISAFLQEMVATLDSRRLVEQRAGPTYTTIDGMLDGAAARAGTALAATPAVESAIRHTLGETYVTIGKYDNAIEQLSRAIAIDRQIRAPQLPDIAEDLLSLGNAELERGNNRAADTLFANELALCRQHPRQARRAIACVVGLNNLAGAKWFEHQLDEAERLYREALPPYRQWFGTSSTAVAVVLGNLGGVLDARGDLLGADSVYRASLAEYEHAGGHDLPQRAFTLGNLADNLATRGRFSDAEPLVHEQIALIARTESANHPDAGLAWVRLGAIERKRGNLVAADTDTRRGLAIVAKSGPIARRLFVEAQTRAALVLLAKGEAERAHVLLQTVLDSASAEFSPDDSRYADVQAAMGQTLRALHDDRSAEALLDSAYRTYQASFGPDHPTTRDAERKWRSAAAAMSRAGR